MQTLRAMEYHNKPCISIFLPNPDRPVGVVVRVVLFLGTEAELRNTSKGRSLQVFSFFIERQMQDQ